MLAWLLNVILYIDLISKPVLQSHETERSEMQLCSVLGSATEIGPFMRSECMREYT
jgi:hypothetical protein